MPRLMTASALAGLTLALAAPQSASAQGLGSLYGCDASGSGNTTGAVVGGLVGALAGSQISRNERTLGAVIGAGLGSMIGNNIGCRMDRKSALDAQQAFERALETGRAQTWSDPATGASGRIEVIDSAGGGYGGGSSNYSGRWRFASGVTPASRVSDDGGAYAANSRINMRAGPSTRAAIVDRLQPGEQVEVAGAVSGGWLAVIEDGWIQGYVSRGVVTPAGGRGDGECKVVRQTINERGQPSFTERLNACRDRNGVWQVRRV
ncbi:MAG: glycine zipper 2TM domain-containing protein [Phenylobacterium sp.]|nr:glycine zipper 2TM domain-containing protein [Phenylobacterium sp.]